MSRAFARTYLYPGLGEVELHSERLAHEDVGVVRVVEGPLQLLQLPRAEVRARAPSLRAVAVALAAAVVRVC